MSRIVVTVPATTANLGPGFDCLGMALELHNVFTVEPSNHSAIIVRGQGEDKLPHGARNLVFRAMAQVYGEMGKVMPPLLVTCQNEVPLRRGLGSSATAVVGGLVAANELLERPLSKDRLLELATALEGHPDNVVAAIFGGCQVVAQNGGLVHVSVPLPSGLQAVLFVPDFEMPTRHSRTILPRRVNRADAVYNLGRVGLLVTALTTNQLEYLRVATEDRLHQPVRQTLFPAMGLLFQAALNAGALGAFLSGSGSTILALCRDGAAAVAQAMADAAAQVGVSGKVVVTRPSLVGASAMVQDN